MKKLIAVLLVLIVCLTAFAACSGEVITNTVNWQENETLTYDISVVAPNAVLMSDSPRVNIGDYILMPEDADQIMPLAAKGTYTTIVSKAEGADLYKITTLLRLSETYLREELSSEFIAALNSSGLITAETETLIEIATEIDAVVVYNYYGLVPIESSRTVRGVYVGKQIQEINDYSLTMKYTLVKKNYYCEAVLTDNTKPERSFTETHKLGLNGFYDNEMLLFVARSFTLSQITANAGAAVIVDPIGAHAPITLGFSATTGLTAYIGESSEAEDVNQIVITTGGTSIVLFVSPTDTVTVNQAPRLSNKLLKFQQGYLVFTVT